MWSRGHSRPPARTGAKKRRRLGPGLEPFGSPACPCLSDTHPSQRAGTIQSEGRLSKPECGLAHGPGPHLLLPSSTNTAKSIPRHERSTKVALRDEALADIDFSGRPSSLARTRTARRAGLAWSSLDSPCTKHTCSSCCHSPSILRSPRLAVDKPPKIVVYHDDCPYQKKTSSRRMDLAAKSLAAYRSPEACR